MVIGRTGKEVEFSPRDRDKWVAFDHTSKLQKFNDGEDSARDLVALGIESDMDTVNFSLKVKSLNGIPENSAYYILIDYNQSDGSLILPDRIKGITDHPWDLAVRIDFQNGKPRGEVLWGMSTPPQMYDIPSPDEIVREVNVDLKDAEIQVKLQKKLLEKLNIIPSKIFYVQAFSVNKRTMKIGDSFNYPKHWDNSNFLVGAFPVKLSETR